VVDLAWIPNLFFDLLGRVIPGSILLFATYSVAVGPQAAIKDMVQRDLFSMGLTILWLFLAYCIGLMGGQLWVSTFGKLIRKRELRIEDKVVRGALAEHNEAQAFLGEPQLSLDTDRLPRIYFMHDQLRLVAREEALRLLKLKAEQRLCHALFLGLTVLAVANFALLLIRPSFERVVLEVVLVLIVVGSWQRAMRMIEFYARGTCSSWFSFASAKQLLSQTDCGEERVASDNREKGRPTPALKRTPNGAA
jgi:hypothetical protein